MKYWKNFRRRVKRNPAVWWPIIGVTVLLVAGVIAGGVDTPNADRKDSASPSPSIGVAPKATGTINDLIVHSIVSINVYEDGRPCYVGSGSVVGDGMHVLTNHHVITSDEDCTIDEIRVQTVKNSGDRPEDSFIGTVLASDEDMDLALLTIKPIDNNAPVLRPLELATTNTVGQDIVVVGFPAIGGDSVTVSKGIISGFTFLYGVQWIKTDAAVSGGNSGGAALDSKNRLIGIPTMASQSTDGEVTDCRKAADTNGDGVVDERDTCVGVGGSFALMATSATAIKFAKSQGLNISQSASSTSSTSSTTLPKK
jgi:S1-C subfamily serine protease